jgi:hypothetical protein
MKIAILLFLFVAFVSSCSDDNDPVNNCNNTTFTQEFQSELDAVSVAATAYAQNQTTANCTNYKAAFTSYIDALENWEDCAKAVNAFAEWNEALNDAKDAIDTLC